MVYTICHYYGCKMDRPRGTQRYCSAKCKQLAYRDRNSDPNEVAELDALPEDVTANDLLVHRIIRDNKRRLVRTYNRASFEEIEGYTAVTLGATATSKPYDRIANQIAIRQQSELRKKGITDPAIHGMLHSPIAMDRD